MERLHEFAVNHEKFWRIVILLFFTIVLTLCLFEYYKLLKAWRNNDYEMFDPNLTNSYGLISSNYVDDLARVSGTVTNPNRSRMMKAYYETTDDPKLDRLIDLSNNVCHVSCCQPNKLAPYDLDSRQRSLIDFAKTGMYVPSDISCTSNLSNAGCLCMTKDQDNFFASRGGNA